MIVTIYSNIAIFVQVFVGYSIYCDIPTNINRPEIFKMCNHVSSSFNRYRYIDHARPEPRSIAFKAFVPRLKGVDITRIKNT